MQKNWNRGMTLIELVVAVAILAVFLGIAIGGVIGFIDVWGKGKELATAEREARHALARLTMDLRSATTSGPGAVFRATEGPKGSGDEVRFLMAAPNGGTKKIKYHLGSETNKGLTVGTWDGESAAQEEEVIASRATGLDFKYRGAGGGWTDGWNGPGLPQAVKITLSVTDQRLGAVKERSTVVAIPAALRYGSGGSAPVEVMP